MKEKQRKYKTNLKQKLTNCIVKVSCQFQQMQISGVFLTTLCFLLKLLGILLPITAIMTLFSGILQIFQLQLHPIYTELFKNKQQISLVYNIVQLVYLLISYILILLSSSPQIQVGIRLITLYYYLSTHLLIFTSQQLFSVDTFEPRLILNIVNIILAFGISLLFCVIRFSYSFKSPNNLLAVPSLVLVIQQIVHNIFAFILPWLVLHNDKRFNVTVIGLFLLLSFFNAYTFITSFIYLKALPTKISHLTCCFIFSYLLIAFFGQILKQQQIYDNFLLAVCSMFIFFSVGLERGISYKQEQLQLANQQKLDQANSVMVYLFTVVKLCLKDEANSYEKSQLLNTNFRYKHINQCVSSNCFCEDIDSDQFQKRMILEKLNAIAKKFQKNYYIVCFSNVIALQHFQIYAQSIDKLKKLEILNKDQWLVTFLISKFIKYIQLFLKKKDTEHQFVKTQDVLECELVIENIQQLMKGAISNRSKIWNKIYRGTPSFDHIDSNIKEQLSIERSIHSIEKKVYQRFRKNKQCLDLFYTYHKFVNLRSKIDKNLEQAINEVGNIVEKGLINLIAKHNKEAIQMLMYSKQCCVFQSKIQTGRMGIVENVSKNVKEVFGFDQKIIKSLQIYKIMPQSMHKQHDNLLNRWVQSGSWTNVGKLRSVFCLSHRQICFQSTLYIKILQRYDHLSLVAIFFMQNDQDYMLINNEQVVDGAGNKFLNLLGNKIIGNSIHNICEDSDFISKFTENQPKKKTSKFFSMKNLVVQEDDDKKISSNARLVFISNRDKNYNIEYEIFLYSMGSLNYKILKILKIESLKTLKDLENVEQFQQEQIEAKITDKNIDVEKQFLINCKASSYISSISNSDLSTENLFQNINEMFLNPSKIWQRRTIIFIAIIIIFCLLGFVFLILEIQIKLAESSTYLRSLEDHLYDSNKIQNLELLFNRAMRLSYLEPNSQQYNTTKLEAAEDWKKLFEQIKASEILIFNGKITIDKATFQSRKQEVIQWESLTKSNTKVFIRQYYLLFLFQCKFLILDVQTDLSKQILSLSNNFPMLESLYYKSIEEHQENFRIMHENRKIKLQIARLPSLIIPLIIIVFFYRLVNFRKEQAIKIISQLGIIEKKNAQIMASYYSDISKRIFLNEDQDKKNKKQNLFIDDEFDENVKSSFVNGRQSLSRFSFKHKHNMYIIILVGFIFLALLGAHSVSVVLFLENNQFHKNMVYKIESLIEMENDLIISSIYLKREILMFPDQKNLQILEKIYTKMDKSIKNLNQLIFEIVNIFQESDQSIGANLSSLLKKDICSIVQELESPQKTQNCRNQDLKVIFQQGSLLTLSILQSNLFEQIIRYEKEDMEIGDLKTKKYKMIDYSVVYLSSFFRKIGERINTGIQNNFSRFMLLTTQFQIITGIVYLFIVISLLLFSRYDKYEISENMGRASIVPLSVIKCTKNMVKDLLNILQI